MGSIQQTLQYFWRQNLQHKWLFFGTSFCWLTGITLQKLLMPLIIAHAIDRLITIQIQTNIDYVATFTPYFIALIVAGIIAQAGINTSLVLLSRLETTVRVTMQDTIFTRLLEQSIEFHNNSFSGSIVAQVKRFTSAYTTLTDTFVLQIIKLVVSVLVAIIILAFFWWPIALAMLAWTCFFTGLNYVLTRRRIKYSKIAAAADSIVTAHLADTIGNVNAVKSFAAESHEEASHHGKISDFAAKKFRAWLVAIQSDIVFGALMIFLQVLMLFLSIVALQQNALTIGLLLLVQVYTTQIILELWGLSPLSRTIEQALSDSVELTETLNKKITVTDPAKPEIPAIIKGAIRFNSIHFTHDSAQKNLFQNFSLSIAASEKIGLVGHSGSGKTTLTRLLLRFSDIQSGTITIDGQAIDAIRQADLRAHIAYVPQEPLLFHRTLSENIAYGKPEATDAEIEAAAKKAHAHEFIVGLPQKYHTTVGERGVKLSGGQRQRIAIARAILKDAPILVLDEATSALDSESEKLIQAALKELMKHRTTIVIAHRLSTIQSLNRIIVLDDGKIIEQGSHQKLLDKKGAYAKLWKHQSGGFIEE